MFGYINPAKEQLGEADYKVFCFYYCGLCKQLGKSCSQMSRLGLSYDITFLFIVLSSVIDSSYDKKEGRCIAHPIKKISYVLDTKVGDYCAKMAGLLSYEKCLDDWNDEKSLKAVLGIIMYRKAYKRAYKVYNQVSVFIKNQLKELSEIEKNNIFDVDIAADKFAKILSRLFTPDFIDDEDTKRQLEWFGYNIGRWIYIIDAIADIRDDHKKGRYNPLLCREVTDIEKYYSQIFKKEEFTLTFTLQNIASTFDLMRLYKNSELLKKIVYISLPQKQEQILKQTGGNNESL